MPRWTTIAAIAAVFALAGVAAAAGAPCKKDSSADYDLNSAVSCIMLGPGKLSSNPYVALEGMPSTAEEWTAECARVTSQFRASGLDRYKLELIDSEEFPRIVYVCPGGLWRVQIRVSGGLFSSNWSELPGGKITHLEFGSPSPPEASD